MKAGSTSHGVLGAALLLLCGLASPAHAEEPVHLTVFAAGTLAVPFKQLGALYQQHYPATVVEAQFGGSVMMAKRITELGQQADVLAVADYSVIPTYLFGKDGKPPQAAWYAGFARNAITFVYTPKSKSAGEITPQNWYQLLAKPGVEIGRSNPDTDPSGYQTVQMLSLAEKFYNVPGLGQQILANAPRGNMRDTETELIAALQLGQIDYLAIYRSDALQHKLQSLALPPQIDLSDPGFAGDYAAGIAQTKNGALKGKPIVYAVTIPADAAHRDWAEKYVALLLGPEGQAVMAQNGFGSFSPAYAVGIEHMPAPLQALVAPWPAS